MLENRTYRLVVFRRKEEMRDELGLRIRKAREGLHISQDYLAKRVNINRTAMVQIENGNRNVSADELSAFSEVFGISADELLNGKKFDMPQMVFARSFSELDETDQNEILNLIEFKKQMKAKRTA